MCVCVCMCACVCVCVCVCVCEKTGIEKAMQQTGLCALVMYHV